MQDIRPVNMGIFMAATNTAAILKAKFKINTELWFTGESHNNSFIATEAVALKSKGIAHLKEIITERNLNPAEDIIVTHGPWNYQSIWGNYLAKQGFKWVYVSHGVLEPCGMNHKWLKKKIYYALVENRLLSNANIIRAISTPEKLNLQKLFPKKEIVLIANGFDAPVDAVSTTAKSKMIFLFMARLHEKKGVTPLVQAWINSSLNNDPHYELAIAGTDEGELAKIEPLLQQSINAKYIGVIYKDAKQEWLAKSSFFVLPSQCEGFPVSLLETAAAGLIPIITESCNFPEILQQQLAIKTGNNAEEITASLEHCKSLQMPDIAQLAANVSSYIKANYNLDLIAQKQYELYCTLLNK